MPSGGDGNDAVVAFSYEPLLDTKNSIRLLTLLPGATADPLRCRLDNYDTLAESDHFVALSYEWGDTTSYARIEVNDAHILITQNLHDFLLAIRLVDKPLRLWADAICINQYDRHDTTEKNEQVKMMRKIYERAEEVFVWLGQPDYSSRKVFKYLYLLRTHRRSPTSPAITQSLKHFLSENNSKLLAAASRVGRRSYWTRTWIVQEIISGHNIRVFCGQQHAPWSDIVGLFLSETDCDPYPELRFSVCKLPSEEVQQLYNNAAYRLVHQKEREYVSLASGSATLEQLIQTFRGTQCRDPHDKIYALLGLASDWISDSDLQIDYQSNLQTLLLDVAAFCKPELPDYFTDILIESLGPNLTATHTPDSDWTPWLCKATVRDEENRSKVQRHGTVASTFKDEYQSSHQSSHRGIQHITFDDATDLQVELLWPRRDYSEGRQAERHDVLYHLGDRSDLVATFRFSKTGSHLVNLGMVWESRPRL